VMVFFCVAFVIATTRYPVTRNMACQEFVSGDRVARNHVGGVWRCENVRIASVGFLARRFERFENSGSDRLTDCE
jgi:hypothetical protein